MTKPFALVVPPKAAALSSRWLLAGLTATFLAACSSVPLPEWPGASGKTSTSSSSTSPAVAPQASLGTPTATTSPVVNTQVQPLPYSSAVAALFPDPSQRYHTPGLATGRSHYTTHTELTTWLHQLPTEGDSQQRIAVLEAGYSQSGLPIYAVLAAQSPDLSPASFTSNHRPTVMLVAGQQGNAPASTEATLALLQELLPGGLLQPALNKINLLIVPRANPDGFNAGTSATANGIELRYDHLALHTPEARTLAHLMNRYQPAIVLEAGEFAALQPTQEPLAAVRANDMGLQYGLTNNSHEFITKAAREWFYQPMAQRLTQAGLRVDWFSQPAGASAQDGFAMDTVEPTTLSNVATLKNAVGLHIASRGSDLGRTHAQRRVHGQVQAMLSVLDSASLRATDLYKVQGFAARDTASKACQGSLIVHAQPSVQERKVALVDTATAALTEYRVTWQSALELAHPQLRSRPCGYWLSPEARNTAAQLDQLGLRVQQIAELAPLVADGYYQSNGQRITVQRALQDATPGSYYISMNQPQAHLVTALLEPDTPYSSYQQGVLADLGHITRVVTPPVLVFEDDE